MQHKRAFFVFWCGGVLLVGLLAWFPITRAYWDHQVMRLCASEGGVQVFETVVLPSNQFDKYDNVYVLPCGYSPLSAEFCFTDSTDYIRHGSPDLWRNTFALIRKTDNKILGKGTSFTRRGGDFPTGAHESSFSCPNPSDPTTASILREGYVFIRGTP